MRLGNCALVQGTPHVTKLKQTTACSTLCVGASRAFGAWRGRSIMRYPTASAAFPSNHRRQAPDLTTRVTLTYTHERKHAHTTGTHKGTQTRTANENAATRKWKRTGKTTHTTISSTKPFGVSAFLGLRTCQRLALGKTFFFIHGTTRKPTTAFSSLCVEASPAFLTWRGVHREARLLLGSLTTKGDRHQNESPTNHGPTTPVTTETALVTKIPTILASGRTVCLTTNRRMFLSLC